MFGEVVGGCLAWREGERGKGWPCYWLLRYVVEWKEVSSKLMWVRVKIERESWVFISKCGPISGKSEEEIANTGNC